MNLVWKNKTVMVCGASAGLGWQLSASVAAQGARVIMIARDLERLDAAQGRIMQGLPAAQLCGLAGDLCDADGTAALAEQIRQRFDQLDLVINAVGESDRGSIDQLSCARMLDLVRLNVGSGLNAIQQFSPLLRPTRGVLVLVGSLSSHVAPRFLGGYSIAKHGLAALAQQSRLELAASGVHVMLVSPGPIARPDAGQRYNLRPEAATLPPEALKSGAGAKVTGLDPLRLAEAILVAAAKRVNLLVLPRKARLLLIVNALYPRLGEFLLRKFTS